MTPKQTALAAINALPDDATWDTIDDALDEAAPVVISPELKATLLRRTEEIRTGKVKTIPVEEVFKRLDEIIDRHEVAASPS